MRVITGFLRGRKLNSPMNDNIRPTTDKVKEAIFSILAGDYVDETVVDLFAGTGNLGIEALSRGAKHVYFSDNSRESLKVLKENIHKCEIEEDVTIIAGDYKIVLKKIDTKVQIFFLDPPYNKGLIISAIEEISNLNLLKKEGVIVAEHGKDEELPEQIGNYVKIKNKKYGKIIISIYAYI